MLKKIYYWLHKKTSRPEEREEYSAGRWQDMVRTKALELCEGARGNILDVGCGEGLFLTQLAKRHKSSNIYGIEIWQDILNKAQKRLEENNITNVKLSHADARSIPFDDDFFDIVVCINVFFNLPTDDNVKQSIKEIARVCKKDGRVIFDIRNSLNPLLFVKYKLAKYYDETVKNLPLRTHKLSKINNWLGQHNLTVLNKINIAFPGNVFAPIIVIEAKKN